MLEPLGARGPAGGGGRFGPKGGRTGRGGEAGEALLLPHLRLAGAAPHEEPGLRLALFEGVEQVLRQLLPRLRAGVSGPRGSGASGIHGTGRPPRAAGGRTSRWAAATAGLVELVGARPAEAEAVASSGAAAT